MRWLHPREVSVLADVIRRSVSRLLQRSGLTLPAYRAFERFQGFQYRLHSRDDSRIFTADGLPLPPASLRILVAGTADVAWFVNSGRLTTDVMQAMLRQNGLPMQDVHSIFDFGCGCGRVIRHWHASPEVRVVGTDYNRKLIRWCSANLPFAHFFVNDLAPPLPNLGGRFSLIYSFSVFTHLPAELQGQWIDELTRVLEPGGLLVLTTHGDRFTDRLSLAEQAAFHSGQLVVKHQEVAGTNLCAAFHPQSFLFGAFPRELRVVDFMAGGTIEGIDQDLTLLRKPEEGEAPRHAGTLRVVSSRG